MLESQECDIFKNETKYLWFLRETIVGSLAPSSPSQAYLNFEIRLLPPMYMY